MTVKKGQKIRAWVNPPPPFFEQCPKENVLFLLMSSLRERHHHAHNFDHHQHYLHWSAIHCNSPNLQCIKLLKLASILFRKQKSIMISMMMMMMRMMMMRYMMMMTIKYKTWRFGNVADNMRWSSSSNGWPWYLTRIRIRICIWWE